MLRGVVCHESAAHGVPPWRPASLPCNKNTVRGGGKNKPNDATSVSVARWVRPEKAKEGLGLRPDLSWLPKRGNPQISRIRGDPQRSDTLGT
jgi:hypothetical protein